MYSNVTEEPTPNVLNEFMLDESVSDISSRVDYDQISSEIVKDLLDDDVRVLTKLKNIVKYIRSDNFINEHYKQVNYLELGDNDHFKLLSTLPLSNGNNINTEVREYLVALFSKAPDKFIYDLINDQVLFMTMPFGNDEYEELREFCKVLKKFFIDIKYVIKRDLYIYMIKDHEIVVYNILTLALSSYLLI